MRYGIVRSLSKHDEWLREAQHELTGLLSNNTWSGTASGRRPDFFAKYSITERRDLERLLELTAEVGPPEIRAEAILVIAREILKKEGVGLSDLRMMKELVDQLDDDATFASKLIFYRRLLAFAARSGKPWSASLANEIQVSLNSLRHQNTHLPVLADWNEASGG